MQRQSSEMKPIIKNGNTGFKVRSYIEYNE